MSKANIIFDKRILSTYSIIEDFCMANAFNTDFITELWEGLLTHKELYDEFVHYLTSKELLGNFTYEGYGIPDLYFYHLRKYNVSHDLGKNSSECDKDYVVVEAFHTMGRLIKEPDKYISMLENPLGMDVD